MKIIIYGSKYGTAKEYACELSKRVNIDIVSYERVKDINKYETIIYIGALYAGGVLGMAKTLNKISDIKNKNIILITVGLSDPLNSENINNIRKSIKRQVSNDLCNNLIIYHLRGGINYSMLSLKHKTMMKLLYEKANRIPVEKRNSETEAMISTYNKKVSFVDYFGLNDIINEINKYG